MQLKALSFAPPLIFVFLPSGTQGNFSSQSSLWVLQLWWVYYMTFFVSKEACSYDFYQELIFQVLLSSASIRVFKPLHPAGTHSYSFSPVLSTGPRARLAPWSVFMEVTVSVRGDLPNTICAETCLSLSISCWESLRNHWAAVRTTTLLIPGTQEEKVWKKPKGSLTALSHMAIHGIATWTTPWQFGFPLPFSVMLSPCAIFASLLSCHATVHSLLILTKESHSPVISSGNGTNLSKFLSPLPTPFPFGFCTSAY